MLTGNRLDQNRERTQTGVYLHFLKTKGICMDCLEGGMMEN